MKKKSLITFILILSVIQVLKGQQMQQIKEIVIDKNAEAIMKKVAQKAATYQSLQLDFTTKTEDKTNTQQVAKKGILLVQGDKYRIKLDNQIVYCDGKTIWLYQIEEKEVQIHNIDPQNTETINFTKLLAEYDKNYRSKLIKEQSKGNTIFQVIDLIPTKSVEFYKIRLSINKEQSQIDQMELYFKGGSTVIYKIENYKINPSIVPSYFVFNTSEHPSIEIIDMR